jgi:hypothetical protein
MYRIAWRSKITGFTGHGDYILSFTDGTKLIKELDEEYHYMEHWLEATNEQVCS